MLAFFAVFLSFVAGAYESALAQDTSDEPVSVPEPDIVLGDSETASKKPAGSTVAPDVFVNENAGIRLTRAGGWLVGSPSHEAVALFRAAGESEAQIEFRVSKDVAVDSRDSYISAFQNSLLRLGFVEIEARKITNYNGRIGQEYEYRVLSGGREFRLITWLYARETEIWIMSGFFPLSKRDAYFRGFQTMLRSLEFTD